MNFICFGCACFAVRVKFLGFEMICWRNFVCLGIYVFIKVSVNGLGFGLMIKLVYLVDSGVIVVVLRKVKYLKS